jgi:hypothetical protein
MQKRHALTHIFSLQQITSFSGHQDRANGHFHGNAKSYWQKMTPLQKRIRKTVRKDLSQKTIVFTFSELPNVQQKQLNVDTKFYESGRVNSDLPPILFQSASKRFTRIYMGRKTERN